MCGVEAAACKAGASDTITPACDDGKNSDGNNDMAKTVILSNDLNLSKKTTFYSLIARFRGGAHATAGPSAYDGGIVAARRSPEPAQWPGNGVSSMGSKV